MIRAGLPGAREIALALDHFDQPLVEIERRDQQLFQTGITGQPGERVEDDRDLLGQLRRGREEAEVGVNARGFRMVIAGAEMDVLPQPIGVAPND